MPRVLWTGKLTPQIWLMLNTSNVFAWATGATRDTDAMKERVRKGYDGAFSDHVNHYDEVGSVLQMRSAAEQLRDVDVRGKSVLDIGGGTGVASFLMLRHGASKVVCGDISEKMLVQARLNAEREGYGPNLIEFCRLDAEVLPYDEGSFDVVSMSMTMGLLPNQEKSVAEMARVARPGGLVSIGAHGPDHYWEPIDATVRGMSKRYIFGYRLEFWPEKEKEVRAHMARAGLVDIMTRRVTWKNDFGSGGKAFDFFAAISASWWYGKLPPERVQEEADRTRAYFERENVRIVTDDIIVASGRKPG